MSTLVAIAYPDVDAARNVAAELAQLTKEQSIVLDDMVLIERRPDGKVKLHQAGSTAGAGAAGGALWGGLIGLLFLAPLVGMAIGAGTGALAGSTVDTGINDTFMRDLGEKLEPGHAALVLLVRSATTDRVLEELHGQYRGELLQTSLSSDEEAQLKMAMEHAKLTH
jgi:uncharacterized membrane protein